AITQGGAAMLCGLMSSRSRYVHAAIGAFFLAVALPAKPAVAAESAALQKVIEGAKKEGTLKVLWTEDHFGGSSGFAAIISAMNKRYSTNIKLQFTQGGSFPANLGRLIQEYKSGQRSSSDLYLGGGSQMVDGMKAGLFLKVDWKSLLTRAAPPNPIFERINPDGIGVAVASRVVGITYNTNLVKGADVPHSMEDVLKPKWKGLVATTPYVTGFYQGAAPDMLGEKFMTDYVKRLKPQIGGLIPCNTLGKIASGQFAMLIFDCGRDAALRYQKTGAPIGQVVPKEFIRDNVIDLGIPANAQNPDAAKLLVVFTQTKEGQELLWKHGAYDLEVYPDSHSRKLIDEARAADPNGKFAADTAQRSLQQEKEGIHLGDYAAQFKKIFRGE
ncbi:MAG: ABC transporter substrate-binding protein, partial [Terriglobales bacterium]